MEPVSFTLSIPNSDGDAFYEVVIEISDQGKVSVICPCRAGDNLLLCRHVKLIMDRAIDAKQPDGTDILEKVYSAIGNSGFYPLYNGYLNNAKMLDKQMSELKKQKLMLQKHFIRIVQEGV